MNTKTTVNRKFPIPNEGGTSAGCLRISLSSESTSLPKFLPHHHGSVGGLIDAPFI